ncbi:MAG: tetratricopeptide repeat protein [Anaerolineales bacterium]
MEPQSFGYWLRRKRKSLDLTREALAAQVGCSAATIRKIEDEERRPSAQIAARLAEIFTIPQSDRPHFIRFARGDMLAAPDQTDGPLPWCAAASQPRNNLPAALTSLVGRAPEIADLLSRLRDPGVRLVTVVGPPGIGKTRLAIETARAAVAHFPDGVFMAALAALDDPALVSAAVLQALGLVEARGRTVQQQLLDGIGEKRLLLVLDNCEHLIDAAADLTASLLTHCPRLTILATSRESLRIPGEWLVPLSPLDLPPTGAPLDPEQAVRFSSIALFVERARAVNPAFSLTPQNLPDVAALCTQLDGLPLAIELLAARMRLMSPHTLLERLTSQLLLSADGMRAVPPRQKTLGNAIAWSYHALTPNEQALFAGLSVFSGGFSLPAAEAVLGPLFEAGVLPDLLMSLADKSLLQHQADSRGEMRLGMLVTIRQFALERLREAGREPNLRKRHLDYFTALAEQGAQALRGPQQADWSEALEQELSNFRAGLEWAVTNRQTEVALRLLGALGWPWEVRGHYNEARAWLEKIRALPDLNHYPLRYTRVLNHIGRHNWTQEYIREARALLEESSEIAAELGPAGEPALADALNWLGLVRLFNDRDPPAARAMFTRSLEIHRRWSDAHNAAISTFHLGLCESVQENDTDALALLTESLAYFRQHGDLFFMARAALFIGYIYMRQGKYDLARRYLEEHLNLDTEIQFLDGMAEGWRDLGNLYLRQNQYTLASQCYQQCIEISQAHGLNKNEVFYIYGLLALHLDQPDAARQRFEVLLAYKQRTHDPTLVGVTLMGLAAAWAAIGQPERAARLYGAGQSIIAAHHEEFPENEQQEMARHIQRAREALDISRFDALQATGQGLSLEDALGFALHETR